MEVGKVLKIQKTVNNDILLTSTKLYEKKQRVSKDFYEHYDKKLDNSISRARTNIFNIVRFNKFKYFYTQTISSKFDRTDLKLLISKISEMTRQLRRLYKDKYFYYLVIPEYHDDGKSWHVHGFLSEGYEVDSYINNNGFTSLHHFDKLGFNSISLIRNYEACLKYSGAYITKDLAKSREVGDKLFFASTGLERDNTIKKLQSFDIAPIHFDFKSEHCFKATISLQEYYNFLTRIDSDKRFQYIEIS